MFALIMIWELIIIIIYTSCLNGTAVCHMMVEIISLLSSFSLFSKGGQLDCVILKPVFELCSDPVQNYSASTQRRGGLRGGFDGWSWEDLLSPQFLSLEKTSWLEKDSSSWKTASWRHT